MANYYEWSFAAIKEQMLPSACPENEVLTTNYNLR